MRWPLAIAMATACRQEPAPIGPSEVVVAPLQGAPRRAAPDGLVVVRERARVVLARHCGTCHEGHQATAQAKALAVFDLDKPDWPLRFDERRFAAALGRLASKPEADRAAFVALRDAELSARASR